MNTQRNPLTTLLGLDVDDRQLSARIRSTVTSVAAFATTVQVIVWLLIGVATTHLDSPWWLWTPVGALGVNAALVLVHHTRTRWSAPSTATTNTQESL